MAFPELTVTVQDDRHVRIAQHDGAEAFGSLELGALHQNLIGLFQDWLNQGKISERRELEIFGALLYQALFRGEVEMLFDKALDRLASDEHLRVQLSFQEEAAGLARLPWEFLYRPDTETRRGFFLATSKDLALSRYLPLQTGRQATLAPEKGPLRVLVAVTATEKPAETAAQPVIATIQKLSSKLPIAVEVLNEPTLENFLDKLDEIRPHVLHFITQSQLLADAKESQIALLEPDGKSIKWVTDKDFADLFVEMGAIPRLIFLQGSGGGAVDFKAGFAGMAPQLIRAEAQAVVAMQGAISHAAATTFSTRFYWELLRGAPVDQAVQSARGRIKAIADAENVLVKDFGLPVLYMRSRTGIIQPSPVPTPEILDEAQALQAEIFDVYEAGLKQLLAQIGKDHPRYDEALVYEQRLTENIALYRSAGDTETRRAERAEIISYLNTLARTALGVTFNEMCQRVRREG